MRREALGREGRVRGLVYLRNCTRSCRPGALTGRFLVPRERRVGDPAYRRRLIRRFLSCCRPGALTGRSPVQQSAGRNRHLMADHASPPSGTGNGCGWVSRRYVRTPQCFPLAFPPYVFNMLFIPFIPNQPRQAHRMNVTQCKTFVKLTKTTI